MRRTQLNEHETKHVFQKLNILYYKALLRSQEHRGTQADKDFNEMRTEISKIQEYINLYDC